MKTATFLSLALLVLAGCAATSPEPASDGRYAEVAGVLDAHGFAPPACARAADSSTWIVSSRPGRPAGSVERVVVRLPRHAAPATVEIRRYVRGPTDWAIVGPLLGGDETAAEARAMRDDLARRLASD